MSHPSDSRLIRLQFYATAPYQCSYLNNQMARSQVAIPAELIDAHIYSQLVRSGFRRSGLFTYRPWCDQCRACVPVRLRADEFLPDRTQRRTLKRHENLSVAILPLLYQDDHYALYHQYQKQRHSGGGMDEDSREQYENFILKSQVDSFLAEFRLDGQLKMVSLIDQLNDGLSSVYTFFDPTDLNASYGTYNILWQVERTQQLQLPHVYLGYWISECRKMAYKTRFNPIEGLIDGVWRLLSPYEETA
ncbi:arginyltransferase [Chitinimonas sp. BJB300]|uniref:arginyltransferase n=1 Tax=Chitinimonas sp. BJB300 TaxID=1559339 RepID=UPI000C0CCE4B|nr:arginyltransferase [Chitinimonas sp. BJB300]PHV12815.1 arginyltransferase [Chitinimonas sp. BJB300]TSJ88060.1 arginyltransferase [Chitinimonas sp. BJB300]